MYRHFLEALCHSAVAVKAAKSIPRSWFAFKTATDVFFFFCFSICSSRVNMHFPASQLLQIGGVHIYQHLGICHLLICSDINREQTGTLKFTTRTLTLLVSHPLWHKDSSFVALWAAALAFCRTLLYFSWNLKWPKIRHPRHVRSFSLIRYLQYKHFLSSFYRGLMTFLIRSKLPRVGKAAANMTTAITWTSFKHFILL